MQWPQGVHLTEKQKIGWQLLQGPQRHTLFVGGARSGKTILFVLAIIARANYAAGSRHLIARGTQNAVRKSIWLDTFPTAMRRFFPACAYETHSQDGYVTLENGSEIWMSGLDDKDRVEKILGMEFATLLMNECSQISYSTAALVRTRLAQKVDSQVLAGRTLMPRAYYDLNPTGTGHWSYRLFFEKVDPDSRRPLRDPEQYQHLFMNPRDNVENIAAGTLEEYESLPERQRKRFLEGVYQTEIEGALWTIETLARQRIELDDEYDPQADYGDILPRMKRIVVAIDPSGTRGDVDTRSDDIGIIVAGLGEDDNGYVLDDLTCNLPPEGWAARAVAAFHKYQADHIIAETNFAGDMVRATIHARDRNVPVRVVTASRGKHIRAEPVSVLFEPLPKSTVGRVWHVAPAPSDRRPWRYLRLEDQLCNFSTAGYEGDKSPDRADAEIWALTELMVRHGKKYEPQVARALPIFAR